MITKEQALKMQGAIAAIREKVDKINPPKKRSKWTITSMPNTFELAVIPYSSIVSPFGFEEKKDAIDFLHDPDNKQLLMDAYLLNEFKILSK